MIKQQELKLQTRRFPRDATLGNSIGLYGMYTRSRLGAAAVTLNLGGREPESQDTV